MLLLSIKCYLGQIITEQCLRLNLWKKTHDLWKKTHVGRQQPASARCFVGGYAMGINEYFRETATAQTSNFPIRVLIISDVRFFRESLAEVLPRERTLSISGLFGGMQEALSEIANNQSDIILLDEALPGGRAAVRQIRGVAPHIPVVVTSVAETTEELIAWAEAGAAGYIPKTAGLADIVPLLIDIGQGKQACSANVAASLLRHLSNGGTASGRHHSTSSPPMLTAREAQIAQMIVAGMCNKDIARSLNIALATTKTHVHHLLEKLNLQRRGQAAIWMREHSGGQ
jgi:two-component system, NarL family, nitrate/nitrite response regulator NarL